MTNPEPVDVLFIAGIGRSGTTLLSRLLGSIDSVENLGEFASFWSVATMFAQGLPCGCGAMIERCPRWEGWDDIGPVMTHRRVTRNLSVFDTSPATADGRRRLGEELARRYGRVRDESGARLLVDASKRPALALALAAAERVRLHFVHMVRDPRAVGASRARPKGYLQRIPAWQVGPRWTGVNLATERVGRLAPPRAVVRYEDLVAHPRKTIETLLDEVGLSGFDLGGFDSDPIEVGVQHSLAGNPDKLEATTVSLELRRSAPLGRWEKTLIDLTTLPVRRRYRY